MVRGVMTVVGALLLAGVAGAAELRDRMEFPASQGTVVFYHMNHINEVKGECKPCHPSGSGPIEGFGKELAHRVCVGCHEPHDGMPEGPTKCEGCHRK
jgi:predicted CXXCH cytochrome family protein